MRLLLDTHIALWAVTAPERLSDAVQRQIIDPDNDVAVSIVALWEIAIKRSVTRRRGAAAILAPGDARNAFAEAAFDLLAITVDHVEAVEQMPYHHRDPFDRLFVATAMVDGYRLVTRDSALAAYGDFVIVA